MWQSIPLHHGNTKLPRCASRRRDICCVQLHSVDGVCSSRCCQRLGNTNQQVWLTIVHAPLAPSSPMCPSCSVDVSVKRVGGGFGVKATRANFMAAACALGAHKTRRYGCICGRMHVKSLNQTLCCRPIRMHMDLETNMKMIGKRYSFIATYQVSYSAQ